MNGCLLLGAFCQFWRSRVNTFTLTRKLCDLSGPLANEQAKRARPSEIQRVAFGQSLLERIREKVYDRQMTLVRGSQKNEGGSYRGKENEGEKNARLELITERVRGGHCGSKDEAPCHAAGWEISK